MLRQMRKLFSNQAGATAVEYGLILALVVLATMGAIINVAGVTTDLWNNVASEVSKS